MIQALESIMSEKVPSSETFEIPVRLCVAVKKNVWRSVKSAGPVGVYK